MLVTGFRKVLTQLCSKESGSGCPVYNAKKEDLQNMTHVSVVFVTVGKEEEALALGQALVQERLAACVNIVSGVRSIYRWKGEVCDDRELLMIMKTRTSLVQALQDRIKALHSYDVPEIIALPVDQGLPEYLDWVLENSVGSES
jgi:periplasmic divalent cation tolerance protein